MGLWRRLLALVGRPRIEVAPPPAEEPAVPSQSLFAQLLDDASLAPRDEARRRLVLRYFATDLGERLLLLEKHERRPANEDEECFRLLATLRRQIAEGTRAERAAAIGDWLRQKAAALDEGDQRFVLYHGLFCLTAADPEDMASDMHLFLMLRMVRYGGPFVDEVRSRHAAWNRARLLWWVQHGVHLDDLHAVYVEGSNVQVPEEASLHHGIHV